LQLFLPLRRDDGRHRRDRVGDRVAANARLASFRVRTSVCHLYLRL